MNSMHELFVTLLKDVHSAETQLVDALPRMAKEAGSEELRDAFETHLKETREQVQRLERILSDVGAQADGEPCEAMHGLVEEAEEVIDEADDDDVRDAGLIAAAQAVEHYEIARYGTLKAWAKELGLDSAHDLLDQTLTEEKHADELLNNLALDRVNRAAASASA
jgi:ferritin-like metal-binding protein YciE